MLPQRFSSVNLGGQYDGFQELQPGDKLLLCSDGLWQSFADIVELAKWLGAAAVSVDICQQLVSEANRRDGSDNISAVVVNIEELSNRQIKFMHSIPVVFRKAVIVDSLTPRGGKEIEAGNEKA